MVINSNITGATGSPLEKSTARAVSNSKTTKPAQSSAAPILKSLASTSDTNAIPGLEDGDGADFNVHSVKAMIFSQPAGALSAQADLAPETVFRLLQD